MQRQMLPALFQAKILHLFTMTEPLTWMTSLGLLFLVQMTSCTPVQARPQTPTLTCDPADDVMTVGSSVSFTCTTDSSEQFVYSLMHNGTVVPNSDVNTTTLTDLVTSMSGSYTCVVSYNDTESMPSNELTITVVEFTVTSTFSKFTSIYFTWSSLKFPGTTANYSLTTTSEDCDKLKHQIFQPGHANAAGGRIGELTSGVKYKSLLRYRRNNSSRWIDHDLPSVFTKPSQPGIVEFNQETAELTFGASPGCVRYRVIVKNVPDNGEIVFFRIVSDNKTTIDNLKSSSNYSHSITARNGNNDSSSAREGTFYTAAEAAPTVSESSINVSFIVVVASVVAAAVVFAAVDITRHRPKPLQNQADARSDRREIPLSDNLKEDNLKVENSPELIIDEEKTCPEQGQDIVCKDSAGDNLAKA